MDYCSKFRKGVPFVCLNYVCSFECFDVLLSPWWAARLLLPDTTYTGCCCTQGMIKLSSKSLYSCSWAQCCHIFFLSVMANWGDGKRYSLFELGQELLKDQQNNFCILGIITVVYYLASFFFTWDSKACSRACPLCTLDRMMSWPINCLDQNEAVAVHCHCVRQTRCHSLLPLYPLRLVDFLLHVDPFSKGDLSLWLIAALPFYFESQKQNSANISCLNPNRIWNLPICKYQC